MIKWAQDLAWKYKRTTPFVYPKRTGEDNIKMDFKEAWREIVEWIHVTQNKGQWRFLARKVTNLRVP
jgi:hypothetical protein